MALELPAAANLLSVNGLRPCVLIHTDTGIPTLYSVHIMYVDSGQAPDDERSKQDVSVDLQDLIVKLHNESYYRNNSENLSFSAHEPATTDHLSDADKTEDE